nr:orf10 protein - Autographa californica nuclear polyhedrosis virus [Autographa californica nucleopolyhedrovirus]
MSLLKSTTHTRFWLYKVCVNFFISVSSVSSSITVLEMLSLFFRVCFTIRSSILAKAAASSNLSLSTFIMLAKNMHSFSTVRLLTMQFMYSSYLLLTSLVVTVSKNITLSLGGFRSKACASDTVMLLQCEGCSYSS